MRLPSSPVARFLVLLAVYVVLGFALFAATGLAKGRSPLLVTGVLFGASLWSVAMTTLLERKGYTRRDPRERVAFGALAGGLSVGGFSAALSFLAWGRLDTTLLPIAALLGGAMQGARAFAMGAFAADDDDEPEAASDSGQGDDQTPSATGSAPTLK